MGDRGRWTTWTTWTRVDYVDSRDGLDEMDGTHGVARGLRLLCFARNDIVARGWRGVRRLGSGGCDATRRTSVRGLNHGGGAGRALLGGALCALNAAEAPLANWGDGMCWIPVFTGMTGTDPIDLMDGGSGIASRWLENRSSLRSG